MKLIAVTFLIFISTSLADGQSLKDLLKTARTDYPLLKAKGYEVEGQRYMVAYAKRTALPSAEAYYQADYATYNNLTGMASGTFIPISGPPSAGNNYDGVFGSVGSLLLNWELATFGERKSIINEARSRLDYSREDESRTLLQLEVNVSNAYLDVIMSHELLNVYVRDLERSAENLRMSKALNASGLKPDVDTAVFHSDYSESKIRELDYEGILSTKEAELAGLLGRQSITYTADSSYFYKLPSVISDTSVINNPLLRLSEIQLDIGNRELETIRRSANPKLSFWSTLYARGSGIRYDGYVAPNDGFSFSRYNYGLGIVFSLPLTQALTVHPLVEKQKAAIHSVQEQSRQVRLDLENQNRVADVILNNKLKIAAESPSFYESALYSYQAVSSRYHSGLANYPDLIQARYALVKAEADLKKAYLDAWKALLYKAAVEGDIDWFLNQITN